MRSLRLKISKREGVQQRGPELEQDTLLPDVVWWHRWCQFSDSALYNVAPAIEIGNMVEVGLVLFFRLLPLMEKSDGISCSRSEVKIHVQKHVGLRKVAG